jgi:glycosyltransferase involved in cell wall biosynthesis
MPLISVCLAVYNGESTIREALDSVRAQTLEDFEIVVVDDGSSDNSASIAEEYGARVIRQPNAGLGAARKRLVEEAKGDWIAFIDHDDVWVADKLKKQISVASHDVVLIHSDCWYEYEDGRVVERNLSLAPDSNAFDHILPSNEVIASSAVFRRDAMLKAGNFIARTVRCSDWYGWFILAPHGRFVHLPEKQVRYRVLSTSLANAGVRFHEAKYFLLSSVIVPILPELFALLSVKETRRYSRMVRQGIGIAASTLAKYLAKEGKHKEARKYHRIALRLAPGVPRVLARALKAKIGLR